MFQIFLNASLGNKKIKNTNVKNPSKGVNRALKLVFALRALAKPEVPEDHLYSEFKGLGTENKFRAHPKMGSLIGLKNSESLKGSNLKPRENEN